MMSRASPQNRRDQRLQTEALRITHLDLFHNAPVTEWVGGGGAGGVVVGATHLLSHVESILREPSPISGWLITVTNEGFTKRETQLMTLGLLAVSVAVRACQHHRRGEYFLSSLKFHSLQPSVFSPLCSSLTRQLLLQRDTQQQRTATGQFKPNT